MVMGLKVVKDKHLSKKRSMTDCPLVSFWDSQFGNVWDKKWMFPFYINQLAGAPSSGVSDGGVWDEIL
jgi:hypothetical protein